MDSRRLTAAAASEPRCMDEDRNQTSETPERKRRLIEAAVRLMLRQGFSATTVDQVCAEAGVTKGSFFHYFASKEEVCRAAMDAWAGGWLDILMAAEFPRIADPLDRLERLFDVMVEAYLRPDVDAGCMIGTVAQEIGASNRGLGEPCAAHFAVWGAHGADVTRRCAGGAPARHSL
jgi:TetR/AcrR family transcriptional regulator, transcriptional repressor for nem operon